MDGLILLIILVPVIFFALLLNILNKTSDQKKLLQSLTDKIGQLSKEIAALSRELKDHQPGIIEPAKPAERSSPVIIEPQAPPKKAKPVPKEEFQILEEPHATIQEPFIPEDSNFRNEIKSHKPNADLEKFIGENIANKIGIAVLVLGIAFFIKYAIDKNWINEAGRVLIGIVAGVILISFAHYLRNIYRSFSSVLVGGGLSVFYFSIAFAFHEYQLIGQTAAFIFMVIISGLGVVLSLFYSRQELAILATIGAFITPFLVSTGNENYVALFTYLCIINAGLMVLSWFKRWPSINIIGLFFTTIIYGGWLFSRTVIEDAATLPVRPAFLYASLFYLLFVTMNIINNIRMESRFRGFDFILVLGINFLYYAAGMIILGNWSNEWKGMFTGMLGAFNLGLAIIFYRKKSIDPNFISLLTGLALGFLSLVAPVQFRGNHIVLFWAAESVVLLWLFHRTRIDLLRYASIVVSACMLISLASNWEKVYTHGSNILPVLINKGFITGLVSSVAMYLYYYMLKKQPEQFFIKGISTLRAKRLALFLAVLLAYLAGLFEVWYQYSTRFPATPLYAVYLQLYSFAVAIVLIWIFRKDQLLPILKFLFTGLCFAFYLFNVPVNHAVSLYILENDRGGLFLGHWAGAILLLWLLVDLIRFFFGGSNNKWMDYRTAFTWLASAGIIFILSVEMYHIILWNNYRDAEDWKWWENLYYKAGLSILWGICSFVMMWLGMSKNFRPLRIISLTLFTITIVKLFGYDIRNVPPGGKIAAFIMLGILLLLVSFMYQRLKKIIIDNTPV